MIQEWFDTLFLFLSFSFSLFLFLSFSLSFYLSIDVNRWFKQREKEQERVKDGRLIFHFYFFSLFLFHC